MKNAAIKAAAASAPLSQKYAWLSLEDVSLRNNKKSHTQILTPKVKKMRFTFLRGLFKSTNADNKAMAVIVGMYIAICRLMI